MAVNMPAHRLNVILKVVVIKGFIFCNVRSLQIRIIGIWSLMSALASVFSVCPSSPESS